MHPSNLQAVLEWQPIPVFLLGEFIAMDRAAWQSYSPWGGKESDTTEQLTHTKQSKCITFKMLIMGERHASK